MIFVATGTTYAFDSLVRAIDEIAPKLKEKVIIQTGNSKYIPKNCQHFKFSKDLNSYIKKASLILAHGGAGTTYEILGMGKKLISVENVAVNDSHQWDLLDALQKDGYLIWCKDTKDLEKCIKAAKSHKFTKYVQPKCTIHLEIIKFLEEKNEL